MKALLYTSDPYEPSGVIGIYTTEEEKNVILQGYRESLSKKWPALYSTKQEQDDEIAMLREIEIPVGVYGEYY